MLSNASGGSGHRGAKDFAEKWKGRGYEKGDMASFWPELLRDVVGMTDVTTAARFETSTNQRGFKSNAEKYRHAYEFLSQIVAYADAEVSKRAMIVAAWGTLSKQPEAVKLGRTNTKEQLKRSKRFQGAATNAIFSGIAERKKRDTLLSSDRDVLNGVINALADIMAAAKEMGELDK